MSTLKELAALVGGELIGNPRLEISGVSEIQNGKPGTITFLANPRYKKYLNDTKAAAVFTNDRNLLKERVGIVVDNPQMALAIILKYFQSAVPRPEGIHPTAIVDPTAEIGENVSIGPYSIIAAGAQIGSGTTIGAHTVIGYNTEIGTDSQLYPRVVIYHDCRIGDRVLIHSGTVIGCDGFGFVTIDDIHHKIPQTGWVTIGHDVELGANCTIDRGTIGDTQIGAGSKFDNLVHVAHNVKIGKGCLVAGEVGFAGSAIIGDYCIFAGQVGVAAHVEVGDRAICAAKTGVTKSISGGKVYAGMPVREIREQNKRDAVLTAVALLKKRLLKLEEKVITPHLAKDE